MFLINDYIVMINDLNENKVPKKWKNNSKREIDLDMWLNRIKIKYDLFNNWIINGYLKIYDLSYFSNEKLFLTLLPIYFTKKLNNSKITSDNIQIDFHLTKYESTNFEQDNISDDIINEFKAMNNNEEFIFIKGLRIKGFEGNRDDEKEIKSYKENDNNPNGELLPRIAVTYTFKVYFI